MPDRRIRIGGLEAGPGEKVEGVVAVDVGDGTVELPIVLAVGPDEGPRVAVTAGVHGGEYVSMPALHSVVSPLEPSHVRGTLVAVLCANPRAFFARAVYVTPPDATNINRVFPGDANGSPTPRLAAWLFQNVIAPSDAFIDMHSGDLNEDLVPFVGLTAPIDPQVDELAEAMAVAYGLDFVIGGGMASGTAVGAAREARVAAIWSEVGGRGSWTPAEVDMHAAGLRRALAAAGVYTGTTVPAYGTPRRLSRNTWFRSEQTGSLYLEVQVGDEVVVGQRLGEVRDWFGNPLQVLDATMAGLVFFAVTSLSINAGDPILGIGA